MRPRNHSHKLPAYVLALTLLHTYQFGVLKPSNCDRRKHRAAQDKPLLRIPGLNLSQLHAKKSSDEVNVIHEYAQEVVCSM